MFYILENMVLTACNLLAEDPTLSPDKPITVAEVEPLVKDFASRWKAAIELMHKDVITSFSYFLCGMEMLRAALTQLLFYYTRLSDCIERIVGGSALTRILFPYPRSCKKSGNTGGLSNLLRVS